MGENYKIDNKIYDFIIQKNKFYPKNKNLPYVAYFNLSNCSTIKNKVD
jgi:hypothetical protein